MNILHLESSGSWGGQEYRTCLEINWLNSHGHNAWLICDPKSEVFPRAKELGTRVLAMPLRQRIDPIASFRIWRFWRRNRDRPDQDLQLERSLALPAAATCAALPVTRARCITDPFGNRSRGFIYKYGCANIVADAKVIKRQLIEQNGIAPEKIEVIGSARRPDQVFARPRPHEIPGGDGDLAPETPIIANIGMIRSDKGQMRLMKAALIVLKKRPDARFIFVGQGTGDRLREQRLRQAIYDSGLENKIIMLGYRWDTPEILVGGQHGRDRVSLHRGFAHRPAGSFRHRPPGRRHQSRRCARNHRATARTVSWSSLTTARPWPMPSCGSSTDEKLARVAPRTRSATRANISASIG